MTYSEEVTFVFFDLLTDVLVKQKLTEDQGAHGLHVQPLSLCQDVLISSINGSILLLLLNTRGKGNSTFIYIFILINMK